VFHCKYDFVQSNPRCGVLKREAFVIYYSLLILTIQIFIFCFCRFAEKIVATERFSENEIKIHCQLDHPNIVSASELALIYCTVVASNNLVSTRE